MVGYFEMDANLIEGVKVGWSSYAVHPGYGTQIEDREKIASLVENILAEGVLKEKAEIELPEIAYNFLRIGDAPYEDTAVKLRSKTGKLIECVPAESIEELPKIEKATVTVVTRLWYLEKMWAEGNDAEYRHIEEQPVSHVIVSINATSSTEKRRRLLPIAY